VQEEAQEGGAEGSGRAEGGAGPSLTQESPTDRKQEVIHQLTNRGNGSANGGDVI